MAIENSIFTNYNEELSTSIEVPIGMRRFRVGRPKGIHRKKHHFIAYVEAPVEFLDTPIPAEAKWGLNPNGTSRILRNFTLHYVVSLDGTKCMIMLAAKKSDNATSREKGVTEKDFKEWQQFLTPYGYPSSTWFGSAKYQRKLKRDYIVEETI